MRNRRALLGLACVLSSWLTPATVVADTVAAARGVTRTYYVAADEVAWDYAPGQMDHTMGDGFDARAQIFLEKGEDRLGKVYLKALYRDTRTRGSRRSSPGRRHGNISACSGPCCAARWATR